MWHCCDHREVKRLFSYLFDFVKPTLEHFKIKKKFVMRWFGTAKPVINGMTQFMLYLTNKVPNKFCSSFSSQGAHIAAVSQQNKTFWSCTFLPWGYLKTSLLLFNIFLFWCFKCQPLNLFWRQREELHCLFSAYLSCSVNIFCSSFPFCCWCYFLDLAVLTFIKDAVLNFQTQKP